jgi:hypothetical protein
MCCRDDIAFLYQARMVSDHETQGLRGQGFGRPVKAGPQQCKLAYAQQSLGGTRLFFVKIVLTPDSVKTSNKDVELKSSVKRS